MTKLWQTDSRLCTKKTDVGDVVAENLPRAPDAHRKEALELAAAHSATIDAVGPSSHIALAVDCLSTPYELATFAVCLPRANGVTAWLPPKDSGGIVSHAVPV